MYKTFTMDSNVLLNLQAIDKLISSDQRKADGELKLPDGEWKMIWSSQVISAEFLIWLIESRNCNILIS